MHRRRERSKALAAVILWAGALISGCSHPVVAHDSVSTFGDAVSSGAAATVWVGAIGCQTGRTGSGFAVGQFTVITAAHVVAGARTVEVQGRSAPQPQEATVVAFDPVQDVAVLRTHGRVWNGLSLVPQDLKPETAGVILGYPKGRFAYHRASIDKQVRLVGRDIYGHAVVDRDLDVLSTRTRPGSSGGPFVTYAGSVAAMVFGGTFGHPMAFAVPASTLRTDLKLAGTRTAPVSTGSCKTAQSLTWLGS
jgi:S1-C subfamily serine protease